MYSTYTVHCNTVLCCAGVVFVPPGGHTTQKERTVTNYEVVIHTFKLQPEGTFRMSLLNYVSNRGRLPNIRQPISLGWSETAGLCF